MRLSSKGLGKMTLPFDLAEASPPPQPSRPRATPARH